MERLEPCPFCGSAAHVWEDERLTGKPHNFPKYYILCNGCKVKTPIGTLEYVVRIWNRRVKDNTPMVATAFRGNNLTKEEESALDHLFDMMTAVKQQVLLRKALYNKK